MLRTVDPKVEEERLINRLETTNAAISMLDGHSEGMNRKTYNKKRWLLLNARDSDLKKLNELRNLQ